ncbi:S-adenosylmethionine uptake transporter [Rhizobium paknamense]|uniref:S-adenosylmethionine uptake transporter n=1 Tax=Rhizobium paknamense TaxID=1206817 RepID=A0ABU0I7S7_9HYPH|nr:S-adenosylmethionine uptake transporter [Rhizobium paknamense]
MTLFTLMQTAIKLAGTDIAAGQITFYRSAFALIPIFIYLALIGQLRTGFVTANVFGHVKRGVIGIASMGLSFYGLVHLPMPDAIAMGYAMPLVAVVFAAVFLKEEVRLYRWTAVCVGLFGVVILSWPKLTLFSSDGFGSEAAMGATAVLVAAALAAGAMLQVRQLVQEEKTATIVLYFSIIAALMSLLTLPFGWSDLSSRQFGLLALAGFLGGLGQIFLTEGYRHADISTIAPFEYSSILFGSLLGYLFFADLPTMNTLIGTVIVAGAGIFIILREHKLGLERQAVRKAASPNG